MGLCSLITRKLDVPDEDGQWIEIRPLSAKRMHTLSLEARNISKAAKAADAEDTDAENYALSSLMLSAAIVAWSYPVPVTPDNVDDLELSTMTWLADQINKGAEVPLPSTPPLTESLEATATE